MIIPDKESFRPDEVAALLAVSRRTVFRWIQRGIVATVTARGSQRIPRPALIAFLSRSPKVRESIKESAA